MLKRILAIGAALAVLLTVSACRSSKSAKDGSSSGYTGSDYTYDGSSGSSEQQSGDSSTTSRPHRFPAKQAATRSWLTRDFLTV